MLRDVAEGREYVITNHGVPAAKVVPITRRSWVPAETLRPLFDTPVDPDFWPDIQAARQTGEPSDPYLKWDDQEPSR
jgi:prevent-host-death family protein